jgi:hypothetical protein
MRRTTIFLVTILMLTICSSAQGASLLTQAEGAAETYWTNAGYPPEPCSGDIIIQLAPISQATVTLEDQHFQTTAPVAAITTYINSLGQPDTIAGPPALFTGCVITLNTLVWGYTIAKWEYSAACATLIHEDGNAYGVPENTNPRSVMDRYAPREPAVCATAR